MNESTIESSPFTEKKTNRLIWIVPSVLLHVLLLVAWLSMPEEPPREPSQRKLTISREQAETLQQHVEDANLVILQQKVSELQAIKKAMAGIRESKMDKLRGFETVRVREIPGEFIEVFKPFLAAQETLITTYRELPKAIQAAETRTPDAEGVLTGAGLEALMPALRELRDLRGTVLNHRETLNRETEQTFTLMRAGESQLEWISNSVIATELSELKNAMLQARVMKDTISNSVNSAYNPERVLSEVIERSDEYIGILKQFEQHVIMGTEAMETKRQNLTESIGTHEKEIGDLETQIRDTRSDIQALGTDGAKREERDKLNRQVKSLQGTLDKRKNELTKVNREMSQLKFVPETSQRNKTNDIKKKLETILNKPLETDRMKDAIEAQAEVVRKAGVLMKTVAKMSLSPVAGAAE